MHAPDLSRPQTNPPMTPWWPWLVLAVMSVGAILAAVVLSRQSGHIAANRQTDAEVRAVRGEVRAVRGEVDYLRDFVRGIEADAASNNRRIGRIEAGAGAARASPTASGTSARGTRPPPARRSGRRP